MPGKSKKMLFLKYDGENIELISKLKLRKHTEGYYDLCFIGLNKNKVYLALIESMSMKQYVRIDNSGRCMLPDCFNVCDEILIRLITLDGDQKIYSNNVFLKQE